MKSIAFNTKMVKAILDEKKTQTRRIVKPQPSFIECDLSKVYTVKNKKQEEIKLKYAVGDILWIREKFCIGNVCFGEESHGRAIPYISQAKGEEDYIPYEYCIRENIGIEDVIWKPSIHMPKEAARIFLKVTDVRIQKLQDITEEEANAEGIRAYTKDNQLFKYAIDSEWWSEYHKRHKKNFDGNVWQDMPQSAIEAFKYYWNDKYLKDVKSQWESNPWVWIIEFERVDKSEMDYE